MTPSITVAICTRHRPRDLSRCVESLARTEAPSVPVEVLVIDDGDAPLDPTPLRILAEGHGYSFRCIHNPGPHGLVHGRVLAIREAAGDVVLFVDDDIEMERTYLTRLADAYTEHPEAAGIGGVDTLTHGKRSMAKVYRRVFLLESGKPGRLSPSGFNGSMEYWLSATRPFETEFLSGCNMSFRKSAVQHVTPAHWLEGYSHGEDMVLSEEARQAGPLFAYPTLKVEHHRSPESRVPSVKTAYTTVRNTYYLLELRRSPWWSYSALYWTTLGLVLKDTLKPKRWPLVPSYFRALKDVSADLLSRKP